MFFFSFIETMVYLLFLHHDNCRCMFLILIQTKPQLFYNIMTTRVASFFIVLVKHLLQLSLSCHDKGRS